MWRMLACAVTLKIKLNILESSREMNYTVTFPNPALLCKVPYVQRKEESQLIKVQIGADISGDFKS